MKLWVTACDLPSTGSTSTWCVHPCAPKRPTNPHQLSQGVVQLRELVGSVPGEQRNVARTSYEHTYVQPLQDLYKLFGSPLEQVMEGESC